MEGEKDWIDDLHQKLTYNKETLSQLIDQDIKDHVSNISSILHGDNQHQDEEFKQQENVEGGVFSWLYTKIFPTS